MRLKPPPVVPPRSRVRVFVCTVAAIALATLTAATSPPDADARTAADPAAVVREWNSIATDTIKTALGPRPSGQAAIWHGFVSVAVYNAVVGIEGGYDLYKWRERGPAGASSAAAAATAAHDVLLTYFPASKARIDTSYADSLAALPAGHARDRGVAYGKRAAARVVELREGDGRFADVPFTAAPAPGVWRPTPPAFQPFIDTWLARLRPLLLDSPQQFRPGGPPALSSAAYAEDLRELKVMGAKTGSGRSARQTETALFFSGNLVEQVQSAVRDHAARHRLGIARTARLFAAVNASATDAVVTAWDAKLHYGSWRPITAIRLADTDGNPATTADPAWEPLLLTPPHPDHIAGHTTVAAAVVRALTGVLGTSRIDLRVPSEVTGTMRFYGSAEDLERDVVDARVWGGVHSRTADVAGRRAGTRLAAWALDHYFRPVAKHGTRPVAKHGTQPVAKHGTRPVAGHGARSVAEHGTRPSPPKEQRTSS
ncbi:vanadium-dependent haloperoxidase [Streptomyces sp. SP2-10]|uniref:vanadium-dependent haloperoxidase n=1 Tax=Streptomyces sp. SP2-10 TaxID=2873385 RepID=UPI001CA7A366|nr:vanadium-dependent haloperoxidase [Streptomyces sp. SP2-10]MBY8841097.1 vanadium-dependent haloperoxidase [Streptomyces sp. SP2-10]